MCASTLDVSGIIEPVRVTPLPFTPNYMLGSFLFRDRVAAAISLRKKLDVRVGEDSAKGPFIVAEIANELAAFWVDEVKDVLEAKDATWQPMPDRLGEGVFDRYTIRDDELILHTSFAALLGAGAVGAFPRWTASAAGAKLRAEDPLSAEGSGPRVPDTEIPQPAPGRAFEEPTPSAADRDKAETEARGQREAPSPVSSTKAAADEAPGIMPAIAGGAQGIGPLESTSARISEPPETENLGQSDEAGARLADQAAPAVSAHEDVQIDSQERAADGHADPGADAQPADLSVSESNTESDPARGGPVEEEISAPGSLAETEIGRAADAPAPISAHSAADVASESTVEDTEEPPRGVGESGSGAPHEAAIESEPEIVHPSLRTAERFDLEAQAAAAEIGEQPRDDGPYAEDEDARANERASVPDPFSTQHRSEITDAPILDQSPQGAQDALAQTAPGDRTHRRRGLAAPALAVVGVLAAIALAWWITGSDVGSQKASTVARVSTDAAPASAAGAGTPQPAPEATHTPPATASGAISRADSPPPEPTAETTRIVTVKTEAFTMTVDRPKARAEESRSPAGVSPGKASGQPAPGRAATQPSPGVLVHVVVRGDTLWDIARKHLGNPQRYPELVKLSGIRNPNLIYPGDIVRIEMSEKRR